MAFFTAFGEARPGGFLGLMKCWRSLVPFWATNTDDLKDLFGDVDPVLFLPLFDLNSSNALSGRMMPEFRLCQKEELNDIDNS